MSSNLDTLLFRPMDEAEQPMALPLLGRCFKEAWENVANTRTTFPIYEQSFGAFDGDTIVGHCGVVPYTVSDGKGGRLLMGGIASVATAPEYRGHGIARQLCLTIRDWCRTLHPEYKSLPLYTGKDRVYESAGWQNYIPQKPMRATLGMKTSSMPIEGGHLRDDEAQAIRRLYADGEDFCGKVIRGESNGIQDWPHVLNDDANAFVVGDGLYALLIDQAVAELYAEDRVSDEALLDFLRRLPANADGTLDLALPRQGRVAAVLRAFGFALDDCPRDLMHGEHPMYLDLESPGFHAQPEAVFYPLADKF